MRIIKNILLSVLFIAVLAFTALSIAVQFPTVQSQAAHHAAAWLSEQTGARFTIEKVHILFFKKWLIHNITIETAPGDTLFHAGKLSVSLRSVNPVNKKILIDRVLVSGGGFYLTIGDSVTNVETLFPKKDTLRDTVSRPFAWDIRANKVLVRDFTYSMKDTFRGPSHNNPSSIDYQNMEIKGINIDIRNAAFRDNTVYARLEHLNGREKSGYFIRHLEGDVKVDGTAALIENVHILDDFSDVRAHYFRMGYGNSENLSDYVNKVVMELDMDNAFLSFRTIQYFAYGLDPAFTLGIRASGKVTGTVNSLSADSLDIHSLSGMTHIQCGFKMKGLPNVPETTLQIDIPQLASNIGDLNKVLYSIAGVQIPQLEKTVGGHTPFLFSGRLAGLLTDFAVDGLLKGLFGEVDIDMVINSNASPQNVLLSGVIETKDLDLGVFTGIPLLGHCSLYTKARAMLGSEDNGGIDASLDTLSISSLVFNNYTFRDFKVRGEFKNGFIEGRMTGSDPNLRFLVQGRANLSNNTGAAAKLFANIGYADLNKLNLYKTDSIAVLSGIVEADFSHINAVGDIEGIIAGSGLSFKNSKGTHALNSLFLESKRIDSTTFRAALQSDALNVSYSGGIGLIHFVSEVYDRFLAKHIPAFFTSAVADSLVSVTGILPAARLEAEVQNSAFLEELFLPGLFISPQTRLIMASPRIDSLELRFNSPRIGYQKHNIKDLQILATGGKQGISAGINCQNLTIGSIPVENVSLMMTGSNNTLTAGLKTGYQNAPGNRSDITASFIFSRDDSSQTPVIECRIPSSPIVVDNKVWTLSADSVILSGKNISFNKFRLQHSTPPGRFENITLAGILSENPADTLKVTLHDFDASMLNPFFPAEYPFTIKGSFSGKGSITDFYGSRYLFVDLTGKNFYVNDTLAGDLRVLSSWNQEQGQFKLGSSLTLPDGRRPLIATGSFRPSDSYLELRAGFNRFQTSLAGPLLTGLVSGMNGYLSGDMLLAGNLPDLTLTSDNTCVNNLEFTIDFTRVPYKLNGPVRLTREGLYLPQDTLYDAHGHYAIVQGGLKYKHFRDIAADLNLNFVNFHALNTTQKDNGDFYGTAFATGTLDIKGALSDLLIDLSARSEPHTAIHIPLSSATEAKETNLLSFVRPPVTYQGRDPYAQAAIEAQNKHRENSQLRFNMKTELTPDAEILLEINKATGDVISGRGRGVINIGVDPRQDGFSILGDCTVESGNYLFVLQGIISKRFQIVPGGTISFNGDVMNTQLNLTASYHTKASLNTLLSDTTMISNRRDVDCQILMSGALLNPTLGFNININDIDPTTRARVESALNTDDKMMRQFMTLLISSSFMPDQESGIVNNSNILYSNATEILSNQLNNIFAQLNIPLDVGFNYQPGQSGDVFDVAISTQLFNNRVIVNGNMGNNPYTQNNNDLVGNIDIELKLDEKGKFRIKAFSRSADQYSNYLDNTQRSGGGFVYQEEFNSFRQLWQRWLKLP